MVVDGGGLLLCFASVAFCWVAPLVKKRRERHREERKAFNAAH